VTLRAAPCPFYLLLSQQEAATPEKKKAIKEDKKGDDDAPPLPPPPEDGKAEVGSDGNPADSRHREEARAEAETEAREEEMQQAEEEARLRKGAQHIRKEIQVAEQKYADSLQVHLTPSFRFTGPCSCLFYMNGERLAS